MSRLSERIVCTHCGERLVVDERTNTAGDTVRRGRCPDVTPVMASIDKHTATPWEMLRRAKLPASALTPGEVEHLRAGGTLPWIDADGVSDD